MEKEIPTNQPETDQHKDAAVKPDPETLATTDPQEHMEGPISTLINMVGDSFNTDQTREEAEEEKKKDIEGL